jgi:hypothetical protein
MFFGNSVFPLGETLANFAHLFHEQVHAKKHVFTTLLGELVFLM